MNPFSRVDRVDFFAVLVPGFYLLSILAAAVDAYLHGPQPDVWSGTLTFTKGNATNWLVPAAALLAAYLLGSLVRALPVNWADGLCRLFFRNFPSMSTFTRMAFADSFPYRSILRWQLKDLRKNGLKGISHRLLPAPQTAHTMYNYWKVFLNKTSPVVFSHLQSLEARVRLFAGMFWTGLVGTAGFVILAAYCRRVLLLEIGTSAMICLLFGYNLRRVRVQEVIHVFLAVAMIQNLAVCKTRKLTFGRRRRMAAAPTAHAPTGTAPTGPIPASPSAAGST